MASQLTLIGNEGFRLSVPSCELYIDAFYSAIPMVAGESSLSAGRVSKADVILVTHSHRDHFDLLEVAEVALRTRAKVVGPATVTRSLRGKLPTECLVEMEPPALSNRRMAGSIARQLPNCTVTAFRTEHSHDHNSYLIETGGLRIFHDGDNENTRILDPAAIGHLDALLIGPWKGAGWVEFIEALKPARYVLMHLSDEELDDLESGKFLPEVCDRVPPGLTFLRPGQSIALP
jgi:L-ascorbate metabolism protein UlaG (beta-lactamase superfamily)